MEPSPKIVFLLIFLFGSAQVFPQVTFLDEPMPVYQLKGSNKKGYLVLSQHQYSMAFSERSAPINADLFNVHNYHMNDYQWLVDVILEMSNDDMTVTPLGFDDQGGLFFSDIELENGSLATRINYLSKNSKYSKVPFPKLKNRSLVMSGCLSKDGDYMVFSMTDGQSKGKEDLYVIKREGGRWVALTNLGVQVNSKNKEITPYLAADNKTLFFASNRSGGKGGFDVYYTIRQDESWTNWSTPVNLEGINTSDSETSFSFVSGDAWGYFVRAKQDVYGNVMQVRMSDEIVEAKDEAEMAFFKVVDIETELTLPATVLVIKDNTTIKSKNGLFRVDSLRGKMLEFRSEGYFSGYLKISGRLKEGENIMALEALKVGKTYTLNNVLFERASTRLLSGSEQQLDHLVWALKANSNMKILLKGHTDNKGNAAKNRLLSQERVDVIRKYLISKGINRKRIEGIGYGGSQPIASNETEETRRLNRRVEFEITEYD